MAGAYKKQCLHSYHTHRGRLSCPFRTTVSPSARRPVSMVCLTFSHLHRAARSPGLQKQGSSQFQLGFIGLHQFSYVLVVWWTFQCISRFSLKVPMTKLRADSLISVDIKSGLKTGCARKVQQRLHVINPAPFIGYILGHLLSYTRYFNNNNISSQQCLIPRTLQMYFTSSCSNVLTVSLLSAWPPCKAGRAFE